MKYYSDNPLFIENVNKMKELTNEYINKINDFCIKNIGSEYVCLNINEDLLELGFNHDDNYREYIDIYIGYRKYTNDTKWRFELRVASLGIFSLNDTQSKEYKYYMLVNQIMKYSNELESICLEYCNKFLPLRDVWSNIINEIDKENAQERHNERLVKLAEIRTEELYKFKNIPDDYYIIVDKSNRNGNFIYRKKVVGILNMESFDNEDRAENYLYHHSNRYNKYLFKVIKKSQIKLL